MLIKFRIKRLENKLAKLRKSHRKNDEIIKFLAQELFKICDDTYDIQSTSAVKRIDLNNYNHSPETLEIENILTKMKITTTLK